MKRTTKTKQTVEKRQLGVVIDSELWRRFKSIAVLRGKTATSFLEECMRESLEKYAEVRK